MDCRPGSGKKREARIVQKVDSVEELVLSPENAPETDKHQYTVQRVSHKKSELGPSAHETRDSISL